ncbi:MAG: clostripain-related cysteine peptidase [Caldilineales bacterium]
MSQSNRGWLDQILAWFSGGRTTQPPAPQPVQPPTDEENPPMQPERDWTILLYMAGDNGRTFETKHGAYALMAEMTTAGYEDIAEVEAVGTTDQVAVLAQFDTSGADGTYRLEIHKGKTAEENIVETIPESNTGDPSELAKFIVWGMTRCPARHTMVVLWNHGLGWKDDDIYQTVRALSRTVRSGGRGRDQNAAMFKSTAAKVKELADDEGDEPTKAILCDDTSMDFLTNAEMSQALKVAMFAQDEADAAAIFADDARLAEIMQTGNEGALRRLAVIGMDACLMSMIEVQYQVRQFADVMVSSQEVEPIDGWPYTEILTRLASAPSTAPADFSKLVVEEYERFYFSKNTTLSAVDLGTMAEVRRLVSDFAAALNTAYPGDDSLQLAYAKAVKENRRTFEDQEYLDLLVLTNGILTRYDGDAADVTATGKALSDYLQASDGPVVINAATGSKKDKASGISIYVPYDQPSPLYQEIDFASAGWLTFLKTVYDAV